MKFHSKLLMLGLFSFALAACQSTSEVDETADQSGVSQVVLGETASSAVTTLQPGQTMIGGSIAVAQTDAVVYFDFDRSTLRPESRDALMRIAAAVRNSNSTTTLRIEGHCDERGTREYNIALGERRAKAVADFLILQGVPASRLETISYGEERPVAMGSTEGSWALNRRAEVK